MFFFVLLVAVVAFVAGLHVQKKQDIL